MKSLLLFICVLLLSISCSSIKNEVIPNTEMYLVNNDSLLIITDDSRQLSYTIKIDYGNRSVKRKIDVTADAFGGMEYYPITENPEQVRSIELWQEGVKVQKLDMSELSTD